MKRLFVTVGSTQFDELIKSVCSLEILKLLESMNFSEILCQVGKGELLEPENFKDSSSITIKLYDFKPSIIEDIGSADVVISHAGAGSILGVLREHKPLIVVINENLMDNHQEELAKCLERNKYLISCTTREIAAALAKMDNSDLRKFPPQETAKFSSFLNVAMGLV